MDEPPQKFLFIIISENSFSIKMIYKIILLLLFIEILFCHVGSCGGKVTIWEDENAVI